MTKPSPVVERLQKHSTKVLLSKVILFQCFYTFLKLKKHVQPDDHDFLKIGVWYLAVKEMSCSEFSECFLECITLKTPNVDSVQIFLTFKILILSGSHKGSESLKWYVCV